jgi:S-adenosylmethionine synthetase
MTGRSIFTSESVTEGHPDKVADAISDAVLDACLAVDSRARVACETALKNQLVLLAGEASLPDLESLNLPAVARRAIRDAGYDDPADPFHAGGAVVLEYITSQAGEIARAVAGRDDGELGAGDQGLMFGYATDETPELMPLPILLAHRLARALAEDRRSGAAPWFRPDGKTQVSVEYADGLPVAVADVLVSTQHTPATLATVRDYVREVLVPRALGAWLSDRTRILVNPAGEWTLCGPFADAGLTGRKIIVDTYGGMARHGGGAFSGKDPTKVDRSGAYFCRWLARALVRRGYARRAEIQVSYALGQAEPVSVSVNTFGTGDDAAAADFVAGFDFRPRAMIERLGLARPIYRQTTNYGHFGRPDLPWEQDFNGTRDGLAANGAREATAADASPGEAMAAGASAREATAPGAPAAAAGHAGPSTYASHAAPAGSP